jgi:RHS repeat-associated protein
MTYKTIHISALNLPSLENLVSLGALCSEYSLNSTKTVQYYGNKVYENNALKRILLPNGYIENGTYFFYAKDRLGNNVAVADATGAVQQVTHYYPYGKPINGASSEQNLQPYKYGGKEQETMMGLAQYDFHARTLDYSYNIFTTQDPLAEKYYNISPYAYCANNPMRFIDPTGRAFGTPPESTGVPAQVDIVNMQVTEAQDNTNMPTPQPIPETIYALPRAELKDATVEIARRRFNAEMNDPIGKACLTDPVLKATAVGGLAVTVAAAVSPAVPVVTEAATVAATNLQAAVQVIPALANTTLMSIETSTGLSAMGIGVVTGATQTLLPYDVPQITINPNVDLWSQAIQTVLNANKVIQNEE